MILNNMKINFDFLIIYRTNTRNRGSSHYTSNGGDDRTPATVNVNRGTHPV